MKIGGSSFISKSDDRLKKSNFEIFFGKKLEIRSNQYQKKQ